jgi:uncharacterized membrane protein (UPF0127 family)
MSDGRMRPCPFVSIVSSTTCLVRRAEVAATFRTRLVGLLGRESLAPGTALVLRPSGLIHTAFMRFPIDVIFLDGRQRVVATTAHLQPFRVAWGGWKARIAVELPAGTIEAFELPVGTPLQFVADSSTDTAPQRSRLSV